MSKPTHEVFNQFDELSNYDLYRSDTALQEALRVAGSEWAIPQLSSYGAEIGSANSFREAEEANQHPPELHTFDRRGRRIDSVDFHPYWHSLMAKFRAGGWIAMSHEDTRPGRWAASIAAMYMHSQVESGTMCPTAMTWASIPLLQREPALWKELGAGLTSRSYDHRDLPAREKSALYIGMGMTEKQGGSDVRVNTTQATALGAGGLGTEYTLSGHKWFFSAPMCDAHLVVAKTQDGAPSCFYVPRWRPDGSKNSVQIQRLKNKVGNRSNSSSEVEFHDAWGILIGEEGRGIPTIIEMASYTRLTSIMSSASFLRQAVVQAIAYTRQRKAFGCVLSDKPLMRAVLSDMAIESEAALVLMFRLCQAFEQGDDPLNRAWLRVATPAAKFWVCKRAVEDTGEAMEVFGGNGYVDEGPMGRLYREAPVNSIWEGSGNVMCLDVLRALGRDPQSVELLIEDALEMSSGDTVVMAHAASLRKMIGIPEQELEALGRVFVQRLVLLLQAGLLCKLAPSSIASAFIQTRLTQLDTGRVPGAIDLRCIDAAAVLERAFPC